MLEPSPIGKERSNLEAMEKKQIKKGRSKTTSFNAVEHRGRWSQMLCTWCAAQANPNRVLDDRPSLIDQTIQNRGENLVSIYEMDKTGHPSSSWTIGAPHRPSLTSPPVGPIDSNANSCFQRLKLISSRWPGELGGGIDRVPFAIR